MSVIFQLFSECDSVNHKSISSVKVDCETTKGSLEIDVFRDWAPLGADHFIKLVRDEFYTDIAFFRAVPNFLVQFGISDKIEKQHWHNVRDDI